MKVGIIGSGVVAQALGSGFLKHGHATMLGTRDTAKLEEWKMQNAGAQLGTFTEAAAFGELVVLAVKGTVAAKVVVQGILDQFGWETADMGTVEAARAIEPLCILWVIPGLQHNDWSPRAFKLLRLT